MPTYDYHCDACGGTFEVFHSMSAAPKKKCPRCGKKGLKRLIGTGAGFIFKGSGFYITDYRSEEYKAKAKAETEGCKPAAADGKTPAAPSKGEAKEESGGARKKAGGSKESGSKAKSQAS